MLENWELDRLTEIVIESVITVHRTLGPGFLENAYRNALEIELLDRGMKVEREKEIDLYYKNKPVGRHWLDLVVEAAVVLELKAVEALNQNHYAQIRAYLFASGINTGLLINFAGHKADYRRVGLNATK
jgi:GxxExxY protein